MPTEKDAVARDARIKRLDADFRWPGGRHVAVVLNVAYEEIARKVVGRDDVWVATRNEIAGHVLDAIG